VLLFLIRRVVFGAATVFITAWFAYGMMRVLRPDMYGREPVISGTWADIRANVIHFAPGQPLIHEGLAPDLYLLAGGVLIAVALGLLLLFSNEFGFVRLPWFFQVHIYAPPQDDPWTFFRSMLVPWIAVGLPVAAQILRLTLALTIEGMGESFVQTARAKGLSGNEVVRRHAAPTSLVMVASLFGVSAPMMVTNMVLIEFVWSVPGSFRFMRAALGQNLGGSGIPDVSMLQTLAVWAAVLIVILGILGDLAIVWLDPYLRASGSRLG
jgi:peptide/nickel transport system permease protein